MCRTCSFFHNPLTGDIVVSDLSSHSETEKALKLNLKVWREGHYLPNGEVECRVSEEDRVTRDECDARMKLRFPTFVSFFNWAMRELNYTVKGSLDLSGLTSAKDLVLPTSLGGSLYLSGLTSAKDLVLPTSLGGSLYLRGLTSAKDLVLPTSIGGDLYLSGLTSAKDLVLPTSLGGSLDLSGLTSAKDLVLPTSIGGSLYLRDKVQQDRW